VNDARKFAYQTCIAILLPSKNIVPKVGGRFFQSVLKDNLSFALFPASDWVKEEIIRRWFFGAGLGPTKTTPKDKHWSPHCETDQERKYGHDEDFGVIRHFGQTSKARKLYKIKSNEGCQPGNAMKKIRQDVGPLDVEVEEAFHHLEVACTAQHACQRQ